MTAHGTISARLAIACAAMLATMAGAQAQNRNCYEDIGCPWKADSKLEALRTLSCENLAHVRNRLYHENGYCFHSKEQKALYGNAGCRQPIQQLVPLTRIERANIAKVRRVEREKGCR